MEARDVFRIEGVHEEVVDQSETGEDITGRNERVPRVRRIDGRQGQKRDVIFGKLRLIGNCRWRHGRNGDRSGVGNEGRKWILRIVYFSNIWFDLNGHVLRQSTQEFFRRVFTKEHVVALFLTYSTLWKFFRCNFVFPAQTVIAKSRPSVLVNLLLV